MSNLSVNAAERPVIFKAGTVLTSLACPYPGSGSGQNVVGSTLCCTMLLRTDWQDVGKITAENPFDPCGLGRHNPPSAAFLAIIATTVAIMSLEESSPRSATVQLILHH